MRLFIGLVFSIIAHVKGLSMISSKVNAILWDVDGTLSDSFMLGFTSTATVLSRNGKTSITEDEYHAGTKYTTPRRLAWHVTSNPDDPIGIRLGQEFDDLYVTLVSTKTAPLYSGIKETLVYLKSQQPSLKYAALSNACGAYVKAVMDCNSLGDLFPVQLGADEVPEAKPSGLGLLHCSSLLAVDPTKCIYVGDSPSDALAATNAGYLCSIGVTWGSHKEERVREAFTYTAYSVQELQAILVSLMKGQDLI